MKESTRIKRKFYHALKRGTGEAYFLVRDHPEIDFSAYLIKGAVENTAYDGQSENSRAPYLMEIVALSQQQPKIRKAILIALSEEEEYTWSLTQLFDLAKLYAQQGDKEAKQTILDRFAATPTEGVGYYEILELDGFEGLIFVLKEIGAYLKKNLEANEDDSCIQTFQDLYPDVDVYAQLEQTAKKEPLVRYYLDHITYRPKRAFKASGYSFDNLMEEISEGERDFIFLRPKLAKEINQQQIETVADMFLREKELLQRSRILSIFRKIAFPYDYQPILKIAKGKAIPNSRIKEHAQVALSHLKGEDIRSFALERLLRSREPACFTDMLKHNYQEQDAALLESVVRKFKDEHIIENLAHSLINLYRINPTKACSGPLIALYEKMNCGIHREGLVQVLIDNDSLPDFIRREIQFDSFEGTRKLWVGLST